MDGVGGNAIMLPAAPPSVMMTPGKGQGGSLRQTYRVEVSWKSGPDARAHTLLDQIRELGIESVESVCVSSLYFLRGPLSAEQVDLIATTLLIDPIVEAYHASPISVPPVEAPGIHTIEVGFHPGVRDPVADHLLHRAHLLGITALDSATTGMRYTLGGDPSDQTLHTIAQEILCNEVIQFYTIDQALMPEFVPEALPSDTVDIIPIRGLSDEALVALSTERVLSLSLQELKTIQRQYKAWGRDPTDVELETLAQTWSEHCQHKTFKAVITYQEGPQPTTTSAPPAPTAPTTQVIDSLIDTYLRSATEKLARPWVRSAFVDNAGIVDFDGVHEISFKVETHNHPSALEPFGGANTGVGGVIRDVIGVSARPIAVTDVLCFAPLNSPTSRIPEGSLHPRRVARGVVAGIEDYGNKMGIPTVAGAILYDAGYVANPLVYCGCVGIAPQGSHPRHPAIGDRVVVLGGRTGRDGLHGATFSSAELSHDTSSTVGSVVQIGDPITEKAVLDVVLRARDERLYTAITDCGAGGLSSAVGEMGEELGVEVDLASVPLKYPGLRPWEIWLSEAQERMVLAVPERHLARLADLCRVYDVEWTVIGHFTGDGSLTVRYGPKTVAELPMAFLHHGWPKPNLVARWQPPTLPAWSPSSESTLAELVLRALAHPDVASKEAVIRRYDHEVQGGTVLKPLTGQHNDGPSDAAVIQPADAEGYMGIALGCGINPHYGLIDPYAMAWAVIDEAVRNVVAAGADPDRIALLDNFCWGNPNYPDRLGSLVRAVQGCHDAALAYGTPFISGKDSLNNEFVDAEGKKRTIPPTLLISSMGMVPDVRHIATADLKRPGNWLYIIGETKAELGGSLYARLCDGLAGLPPAPVPEAPSAYHALHVAIREGRACAVHDLSEGGLVVAAAEMCISGRTGLTISLQALPRSRDVHEPEVALFAESSGRLLVEVTPEQAAGFEALFDTYPIARIGEVVQEPKLTIYGFDGTTLLLALDVAELTRAWKSGEII